MKKPKPMGPPVGAHPTEHTRWVLVCKGQPVDKEHVGVLFDSIQAAESVRDDVNTQTTTGEPLEVVEVAVRKVRFFGLDAWALVG